MAIEIRIARIKTAIRFINNNENKKDIKTFI